MDEGLKSLFSIGAEAAVNGAKIKEELPFIVPGHDRIFRLQYQLQAFVILADGDSAGVFLVDSQFKRMGFGQGDIRCNRRIAVKSRLFSCLSIVLNKGAAKIEVDALIVGIQALYCGGGRDVLDSPGGCAWTCSRSGVVDVLFPQDSAVVCIDGNNMMLADDEVAAIGRNRRDWVLIGGPPCQAYSSAGKS